MSFWFRALRRGRCGQSKALIAHQQYRLSPSVRIRLTFYGAVCAISKTAFCGVT